MKLMSNLFPIPILMLVCSCISNHKNEDTTAYESKLDTKIENEVSSDVAIRKKFLPIPEFRDFKKNCETSGILPKLEWSKYQNSLDDGKFGFYTLFNDDRRETNKFDRIGQLVVFVPHGVNWTFEDPNQTFVSVQLQRSGIKLFGKIEVGSSIQSLKSEIGQPNIENDSLLVFYDSNGTISIFEIFENSISNIKYGLIDLQEEEKLTIEQVVAIKNAW